MLKWLLTNFHNQKELYYIGQNISHGIRIYPPLNSLILLQIAQNNQVSFTVNFSKPITLTKDFQKKERSNSFESPWCWWNIKQKKCLTRHLHNWFKLKYPNRDTFAITNGFVIKPSTMETNSHASSLMSCLTVKEETQENASPSNLSSRNFQWKSPLPMLFKYMRTGRHG